jgi:tetratricopeptide (TPR) repeat protein
VVAVSLKNDATDEEQRDDALNRAIRLSDQVVALRPDRAASYSNAANVHLERANLTGDTSVKRSAAAALESALRIDPHNLQTVKRLADIRFELDDHVAARELYERALRIDGQLILDPLKRMTDDERRFVKRRIAALGN